MLLKQLIARGPLAIVYGTGKETPRKEASEIGAGSSSQQQDGSTFHRTALTMANSFYERGRLGVLVLDDQTALSRLPDLHQQGYNFILLGHPRVNALTQRIHPVSTIAAAQVL